MQIQPFLASELKIVGTLDKQFGYTPQQVYEILTNLGEAGRNSYKVLLLFDLFFPLSYCLLLALSIIYLWDKKIGLHKVSKLAVLLPIIGMLCDYCENIGTFILLTNFPKHMNSYVKVNSVFTQLKWIFLLTALFVMVSGFIYSKINKIRSNR